MARCSTSARPRGESLAEPPAARQIRAATDAGAALFRALERIVLDIRLTGDQAKTLAHETAHALAGHRGGLPREDAETVAKSAAYVVLAHYGLDASGYTFPYVARWAEDQTVLTRNLVVI